MKLLSIIIATYNAGNTLDACLTSITKQKSSEIELLIIDGGSSDKTLDIIHSYGDKIDVLISDQIKVFMMHGIKVYHMQQGLGLCL